MLCQNHLKSERQLSEERTVSEIELPPVPDAPAECLDTDYEPEEVQVSEDILDLSMKCAEDITRVLDASPLQFQLKRKLEYIDDNTKQRLARKFKRLQESLETKFAESIAPGQADDFIDQVLQNNDSNDDNDEKELPDNIKKALKMYKQSDSIGKLVIISMLNHSQLSKQFIMKVFYCSKYRVDLARKFHASSEGLVIPKKNHLNRSRLDLNKCEHFLDFIFNSGLLQDVAYGVTNIKYDSDDEQKIAHCILTTKYSHAIAFYHDSCKDSQYTPLSDSSLWKILHAIKPSQRKSLAGLDDTTAAGMNGFATLQKIAKQYNEKSIDASLEQSKRYMKTCYQVHCSDPDTKIASHCAKFALSDTTEQKLQPRILRYIR